MKNHQAEFIVLELRIICMVLELRIICMVEFLFPIFYFLLKGTTSTSTVLSVYHTTTSVLYLYLYLELDE